VLLLQARVVGLGPLDDVTFRFSDDAGAARHATVLLGGGGVGKTSLLHAIASTRPGHAVALRPRRPGEPSFAVTDWSVSAEDPSRPHTLRVASPNAQLGEAEDVAMLRRREQALFDRRASEGGFALAAFSGARWLSRTSVLLGGAERLPGRADVRAAPSFDDPTRADLARETKQALAFPVVSAAVARGSRLRSGPLAEHAEALEASMRQVVAPLARLGGHAFAGVDPLTFEPLFERLPSGTTVPFDELPAQARHLVALGALSARAVQAAFPRQDPRACEGVVLVDDADLHLDSATRRALVPVLREALPAVQWILAASSPEVALPCEPGDVLALRRMPDSSEIRLYEGEEAVVH
jgi:hypothetical protein